MVGNFCGSGEHPVYPGTLVARVDVAAREVTSSYEYYLCVYIYFIGVGAPLLLL